MQRLASVTKNFLKLLRDKHQGLIIEDFELILDNVAKKIIALKTFYHAGTGITFLLLDPHEYDTISIVTNNDCNYIPVYDA